MSTKIKKPNKSMKVSEITSQAKFFDGNVKIGHLLNWGKLAGAGEINGCTGTCGKFCNGCYDPNNPKKSPCYCFKSYSMYPSVAPAHIRNTVAMREDPKGTFQVLDEKLSRKKTNHAVRILTSGEFEDSVELWGWINLAKKHPERKFYTYTKNGEVLGEVMEKLKKNKKALPANLWINVSIWHENGIDTYMKWKNCKNIRAFVYVDDFDYEAHGLKIENMCPAYDAKGKLDHRFTCDKCAICMSNRYKVLGCYDH